MQAIRIKEAYWFHSLIYGTIITYWNMKSDQDLNILRENVSNFSN